MTPEREPLVELLGDYELGAELGRGSHGVVWSARHRQLDRHVAVKQLVATSPAEAERFRREARLLASLRHPHLVSVFDYRETDRDRALVMEALTGGTLGDRRAALSLESAIAAALAAASALHHVHLVGVLHRDVKPENLMFDDAGHLRVTDFGVAGGMATDDATAAATMAGMFVGTPAYASPEQCGEALGDAPAGSLTARSDQYGLAVVTYELLTGELPHDRAGGVLALANRRLREPARPILEHRPGLAPEIAQVVMRALERVPADRYDSVEEFGIALAAATYRTLGPAWLERSAIDVLDTGPIRAAAIAEMPAGTAVPGAGLPAAVQPAPSGRRTARTAAIVAAMAVIGVGAGTWAWVSSRSSSDEPSATSSTIGADNPAQRWRLETGANVFSSPAVDGDRVVVGSDDGAIYAVNATTGVTEWTARTDAPVRSSPVIAAGLVVVGGNDGNLRALDLATGAERWIRSVGFEIVSSPRVRDNTVVVGADQLYAFDLATGEPRWSVATGPIVSSPAISDGGLVVAGTEDAYVTGVDLASGAVRWKLRTADAVQASPAVVGNLAVAGSRDGNLYAIDLVNGSLTWSVELGSAIKSSPTVAGDRVIVGTDAGTLVARSLRDGGAEDWTFVAGDKVDSSPLVIGDRVVVGSNDSKVHVVDLVSGAGVGSFTTGGPVLSSPRRVGTADVVIGSSDRSLYRIGPIA